MFEAAAGNGGMSIRWIFLPIAFFMAWGMSVPSAWAAQPAKPVTIEHIMIQSDWGGLNPDAPFKSVVIIMRKGNAYQLVGLSHDRQHAHTVQENVDAGKVERLLAALKEPLQSTFRFVSLGGKAPKILRQVRQNVRDIMSRGHYTRDQSALLNKTLADKRRMEAVISHASAVTHTDDFPSMSVTLTLSNFKTVKLKAASQHMFMLPWKIAGRGVTWNPAIAQAVHDLLPAKAVNRDRLAVGAWDTNDLADMLLSGLDEELRRLGADAGAGDAVRLLGKVFNVHGPQILVHLQATDFGPKGPKDLVTRLTLAGMPSNVDMRLRVPLVDGKAQHLDDEIARAQRLFRRVAEAPAMMAVIMTHPKSRFTIKNWYGLSLHDHAMDGDERSAFRRYMKVKKGMDLDAATLDKAILIDSRQQWVLLPDQRVVMWREIAQNAEDGGQGCPKAGDDSWSMMYHCIGTTFSPSGH